MKSFRNLPIRRKLIVAMTGTAMVALILACTAFVLNELRTFERSLVQNLTVLADALGKNCTAALKFERPEDAEETLDALTFEPSVAAGALYTESGELFAGYLRSAASGDIPHKQLHDEGAYFSGDYLMLFRPVYLNEKKVGVIFLRASLKGVHSRIRSYLSISFLVLVGSLLLAFVVASFLRRLISEPIMKLAEAAKQVRDNRDYNVRVQPQSVDELGMLSDAFNHMLADIQQREQNLREANAQLKSQVEARIAAELQLKRLNEELEERVDVRTRELRRSNQELEQFAYVASHDLQEPLRMVSSFVQLLEKRFKGQLDAKADEWIAFAVDGAKRMQGLIQDLLAYSRVGTRGSPLVLTDCNQVVKEVLVGLQLVAKESDATITCETLPHVMADPSQLSQLFQNLISNALKFRGKEKLRVHVAAQLETGQWNFSVSDNGIGIDPQFFERIFILFQRLHKRGEYPGTGIGLAVCRKIVERHRGRIWVESTPGKGATFHFTLPDL